MAQIKSRRLRLENALNMCYHIIEENNNAIVSKCNEYNVENDGRRRNQLQTEIAILEIQNNDIKKTQIPDIMSQLDELDQEERYK